MYSHLYIIIISVYCSIVGGKQDYISYIQQNLFLAFCERPFGQTKIEISSECVTYLFMLWLLFLDDVIAHFIGPLW